MPLIIRDELLDPPTWLYSFRDLTLYCTVFLKIEVVIESEDADLYYPFLKPMGCMDFVKDFVKPESQEGVILDLKRRYPDRYVIITDRIVPENVHMLVTRVRSAA